jgi:CubicO group peptidase (beta-lactamase class C family)
MHLLTISACLQLAKIAGLIANNGSIDDIQFLSPEVVQRALEPLPWMVDAVVSRNVTFTVGGWGTGISFPGSENTTWVGWGGVGGSMCWWNMDKQIGFSYVMNSMSMSGIGDSRSWRLIKAFVDSFDRIHSE